MYLDLSDIDRGRGDWGQESLFQALTKTTRACFTVFLTDNALSSWSYFYFWLETELYNLYWQYKIGSRRQEELVNYVLKDLFKNTFEVIMYVIPTVFAALIGT